MQSGFLVAKIINKLGLSIKELESISCHKLMYILDSNNAVEAADNLTLSRILDNHLFLKSKKTKDKYKDLYKDLQTIFKKNGQKVVRGFDINKLIQLRERKVKK